MINLVFFLLAVVGLMGGADDVSAQCAYGCAGTNAYQRVNTCRYEGTINSSCSGYCANDNVQDNYPVTCAGATCSVNAFGLNGCLGNTPWWNPSSQTCSCGIPQNGSLSCCNSAPPPTSTPAPPTPTSGPGPTSPPGSNVNGYHDGFGYTSADPRTSIENQQNQSQSNCRADGWAVDLDNTNQDLNIRVLSDGVQVATGKANIARGDLTGICPEGTCSYSVGLWSAISHNVPHLIVVQAQDINTLGWVTLNSSSRSLNCKEPPSCTINSVVVSPNPMLTGSTSGLTVTYSGSPTSLDTVVSPAGIVSVTGFGVGLPGVAVGKVNGLSAGTATITARGLNAVGGVMCSSSTNVTVNNPTPTVCPSPAAPSGLTCSASGSAAVRLYWTDNSNNESNFVVWRDPPGTSPQATLAANSTTYINTDLTCGKMYQYQIQANNSCGSSVSNVCNVTPPCPTNTPIPTPTRTPTPTPTLGVPTITSVVRGCSQNTVNWSAPGTWSDVHIYRCSTAGCTPTEPAIGTDTASPFVNTGLTNGTTYYYRIRSHNHTTGAYSSYSNIASGVPVCPTNTPIPTPTRTPTPTPACSVTVPDGQLIMGGGGMSVVPTIRPTPAAAVVARVDYTLTQVGGPFVATTPPVPTSVSVSPYPIGVGPVAEGTASLNASVYMVGRATAACAGSGFIAVNPAQTVWFAAGGGDVMAAGGQVVSNIPPAAVNPVPNVVVPDDRSGLPGVAIASGGFSGFSGTNVSSQGWLVTDSISAVLNRPDTKYDEMKRRVVAKIAPSQPTEVSGPIGGESLVALANAATTTKINGISVLASTGDVTVTATDLGTARVLLLVDGNVTINGAVNLTDGSGFLAILAGGNIAVGAEVGTTPPPDNQDLVGLAPHLEGIFLAGGVFSTGAGTNQLRIDGSVMGMQGVNLQRTSPGQYPAHYFVFRPDLTVRLLLDVGLRRKVVPALEAP